MLDMSQAQNKGELLWCWYLTLPSHLTSGARDVARLAAASEQSKSSENSMQSRKQHDTLTHCMQCDEAQPSCRNCAKSKRECLGYDPIFKQQAGPTNIKPAPSPTTLSAHLSTTPPIKPNAYQAYPGTTGTFVPRGPDSLYPYQNHLEPAPQGHESSSPDMAHAQSSPGTKLQPIRRGETSQ